MKKKIIVCDDDASFRLLVSQTLKDDYDIVETDNGREAIKMATSQPFDLLITDIKMPQTHGLEVVERVREKNKTLPIMICSAFPAMKEDFVVKTSNIAAFFAKPINVNELKQKVFDAIGS